MKFPYFFQTIYIIRVDAAIQVLESTKVEIDVPEILKQISLSNVKTIKGSIDERDALRRALEQNPDTFYTKTKDETKFGLVKNRPSSSSSGGENTKSKKESQKRAKANGDSDHRREQNGTNGSRNGKMNQKRRKESAETRMRKLSNDDLLSPDTPLVGINFKDFINEEKFNKLGIHIQVNQASVFFGFKQLFSGN